MAIDETITRPKSALASTSNFNITQDGKSNKISPSAARMSYLVARRNRIERWAYTGRSSSISDRATTASVTIGILSTQKRSESSFSQIGRKLDINLMQLSEQRQKVIERRNFDQKLFANKQALKHKDNPAIMKTLTYVRKCCKYADTKHTEENSIDPKIFLEENSSIKRSRSRSPSPTKRNLSMKARTQTSASLAETFLKHNKKYIQSYGSTPTSKKLTESKTSCNTPTVTNPSDLIPTDDESQKRHVQFRIANDGTYLTSQSAHVNSKSRSFGENEPKIRNVISADGIQPSSSTPYDARPSKSAPPIRPTISQPIDSIHEQMKPSPKPRRSLSRISSAKSSIQEFRLHPERYLSPSNRYLPLLLRQATDVESKDVTSKQQRERNEFMKRRSTISPPISRLSDGSDLTYDEAKSFLSEENDLGKYTPRTQLPMWILQDRKLSKKFHPSNKIDMMQTDVDDSEERNIAIARLRDREYAHLRELINTSPIDQILEPFSTIKTDEDVQIDEEQKPPLNSTRQQTPKEKLTLKSNKIRQLGDILHSIDSLRCSDGIDGRKRREVDLEKNRAKLGILIF